MPSSPETDGGDGRGTGVADEPSRDLLAELAVMEDRFKRAVADLDNYRKRSLREVQSRIAEREEASLRDWLEVIDSVERAMRMEPDPALAQGLGAVLEQIDAVLARQGVTRIGAAGEPFDPQRHEAISAVVDPTVTGNTIRDIARSGFAIGDRVVRPAEVVVARRPPDGS